MIFDFYILEKKGTCIFHQNFSVIDKKKVEADLISGFFSAMFMFSKEISDRRLEILELEGVRLIFEEGILEGGEDQYIFVAFVDESESTTQIQDILSKIKSKFLQNYGKILISWNRNTEVFNGFEKQIELIIIKADLDRFMLIEKLEEIIQIRERTHLEGIAIYTIMGDLMISDTELPQALKSYISKTIELQLKTKIAISRSILTFEGKYLFIRPISDNLIAAILMKPSIAFRVAETLSESLFSLLRSKISNVDTKDIMLPI